MDLPIIAVWADGCGLEEDVARAVVRQKFQEFIANSVEFTRFDFAFVEELHRLRSLTQGPHLFGQGHPQRLRNFQPPQRDLRALFRNAEIPRSQIPFRSFVIGDLGKQRVPLFHDLLIFRKRGEILRMHLAQNMIQKATAPRGRPREENQILR